MVSPSCLRDDHLCGAFVELCPQVLVMECHFDPTWGNGFCSSGISSDHVASMHVRLDSRICYGGRVGVRRRKREIQGEGSG